MGLEDDMDDNEHSSANDDGLDDIWKEMTFAMESSKVLFSVLSFISYEIFTDTFDDLLVKILLNYLVTG